MPPGPAGRILATRVRERRLERAWTQAELAERSGVSAATIKVFEARGQITLSRLLLLARALDALGAFDQLFQPPAARSLDEIEARAVQKLRPRQRGRRRS